MGHQCIDLPALGECLVVDCGNHCIWRMGITGEGAALGWENKGRIDVLHGHAPRQAVITPDGEADMNIAVLTQQAVIFTPSMPKAAWCLIMIFRMALNSCPRTLSSLLRMSSISKTGNRLTPLRRL
jgi:hypothetical protein